MDKAQLSISDVRELAVSYFIDKGISGIKDTTDVDIKLISTGKEDKWYVAYNRVMTKPVLFMYHINKPESAPHYIQLKNKSEGKIEHVFFENVCNDDIYELVVDLHHDYDLAFQGKEIIVLRHPFDSEAEEIFSFPYMQVWEHIDTFDHKYGMPEHKKRIENQSSYEFFEGYILLKGIINYRDDHVIEYKWNAEEEEFNLVFDEELHEVKDEENKGITHKVKGNKILVPVNAHEEGCAAYLIEDHRGRVLDISEKIHNELLCSQITSLSKDGRYLIYTDQEKNSICVYDIEEKNTEAILENFRSYEGVSEVVWAPGTKMRFAFITVNQEELLKNSCIYIFTFDKSGKIKKKIYNLKVHYECNAEGWCVPAKDYNYKFDRSNRFIYKESSHSAFKALNIK
jgi:hypothetical protein